MPESNDRPARLRVLIVDGDRHFARHLSSVLRSDAQETVDSFSLVGVDLDGVDLLIVEQSSIAGQDRSFDRLRKALHDRPGLVAIVLADHAQSDAALAATRAGAADYLSKPIALGTLRDAIARAMNHRILMNGPGSIHANPESLMIGTDRRMRGLFERVEQVAAARSTLLIVGESGTGKSMIARAIHGRSPRRDRPFVEVSCGALQESLLESELFGHVAGAFTDAIADKPGRFAAANGGTIFLDEIDNASPLLQAKLLRVIEDGTFEPVGSNQTQSTDTRVIAASTVGLAGLVKAGTFRQDLFYRLNVLTLTLPPLRDRPDDLPLLVERFLADACKRARRPVLRLSEAAMSAIRAYAWPGNVRELENAIERATLLARGRQIERNDLPPGILLKVAQPIETLNASGAIPLSLETGLLEPERRIIEAALIRNGWCRQATARELGIERTTLYKKMRKLGIGKEAA